MTGALLACDIDDQATRLYAGIAERLGKSKGLMDSIGAQLVSGTLRRFQTQTGPDGKPWTPLSKATLKKRGANAKALQASGRLRQSITFSSTAKTVEVGSNLVYAALMQMGGNIDRHAGHRWLGLRQVEIEKKDKTKATVTRFAKGNKKDDLGRVVGYGRGTELCRVEWEDYVIPVPARPYLGLSAADERSITRIAHDYVMGGSS